MRNQNGNVFIYILIAIVLLAALNAIISRSGEEDGSSQRLSEAKRSLLVDEIMLHASTAEKAVRNMQTSGTDISFNAPSTDDFYATPRNSVDTPAYDARPLHNLLHPKGGGLQHKKGSSYPATLFDGSPKDWVYQTKTNVSWGDSSDNEIIVALPDINKSVCEEINKRITGSKNIPKENTNKYVDLFDEEAGSPVNLEASNCSDCEGMPALCIEDTNGVYVYYNILVTQ